MPSFLLMALGDISRVQRVSKFVRTLERMGGLTVLAGAVAPPAWSNRQTKHIPLQKRNKSFFQQALRATGLLCRRYEAEIWSPFLRQAWQDIKGKRFDTIICQDIILLPLACRLASTPQNAGRTKVIMDAREFYPRQFENSPFWRLFLAGLNDYLCHTYLPKADVVFTVSSSLQKAYKEHYGVHCELLLSCAPFHQLAPRKTGQQVRLIHHGNATPGRKLESMIEVARHLGDRFLLDLMLMPTDAGYLKKLQDLADKTPRVRIIPPVPMPEIIPFISQYDMGIFFGKPATFNLTHCLPNKIFEFIQARLAVVIGPSPDMSRLVRQHGLGIVGDDFTPESLAKKLQALTPQDIDSLKANTDKAAATLSWETCEVDIRSYLLNE